MTRDTRPSKHMLSMSGDRDKPLPTPDFKARVVLKAAKIQHGIRRWFKRKAPQSPSFSGWRATTSAGVGIAFTVLIANIGLLSWGMSKPTDARTGMRILSEDCASSHSIFTWSHVLINILSTVLLASSNATMQCLSAPSRAAIDKAHAKGLSLDIGISGIHNWAHMDRWRQICWVLLLISSVPLHLLYNSAIFETTGANNYQVFLITPEFLHYRTTIIPPPGSASTWPGSMDSQILYDTSSLRMSAWGYALRNMSTHDCIQNYGPGLTNTVSSGFIVTNDKSNISLIRQETWDPLAHVTVHPHWICQDNESSQCELPQPDHWDMDCVEDSSDPPDVKCPEEGPFRVAYCLTTLADRHCCVQLIPVILGVVLLCNIIKATCFVYAVYMQEFTPLITLGDGLCSFLEKPDPYTKGLGPLSAAQIRQASIRAHIASTIPRCECCDSIACGIDGPEISMHTLLLDSGIWEPNTPRRWFSGASSIRWCLTYLLMIAMWSIGLVAVILQVPNIKTNGFYPYWHDFGKVTGYDLVTSLRSSLIANILLANLIQVIMSLTYLAYNGLFTCILLSSELLELASKRSGLRVTDPVGQFQRSSYYLTLPYRFSVPLLVLSGTLHWSFSQSLYLAEVTTYTVTGEPDARFSPHFLGYSVLGIIISFILGTIMILMPLIFGCLRYSSSNAPLVESSSYAISAACHPRRRGMGEGYKLLKYGIIDNELNSPVGLSSRAVTLLRPGKRYSNREPLNPMILDKLSPANLRHTPLQITIKIVLVLLSFIRIAWFIYYLICVPVGGPLLITYTLIIVLGIYLLARAVAEIVCWLKGLNLRMFYWHILPEIFALVLSGIVTGIYLLAEVPQGSPTRPYISYDIASTMKDNPPALTKTGWIIPTVASVTWILSLGAEIFLWRQQNPRKWSLRRRLSRQGDSEAA